MAITPRFDPLNPKFFQPVSNADFWSNLLFYLGAVVSIATPFVDKKRTPQLYDAVFMAFALIVVAMFVLSLVLRVYLNPRAQEARRHEFLSTAFQVRLTHEETLGYYNNNASSPMRRLAAQTLENSLFSKTISLKMAKQERVKVAIYSALWLVAIFNRSTDLGVVAAASQAVFSEQVLSKWARLEWLRMRFESTYERLYALFQSDPPSPTFDAMTVDYFSGYEAAKASAAVSLSSKIFGALNPELSHEWEKIRGTLHIDSP